MALGSPEAHFLRDLVYQRSSIVLDDTKGYLIETRLDRVARAAGLKDVNQLIHEARAGRMVQEIVEGITTHETSFFRDRHPFDALKEKVIPELLERRQGRRLHIWSAACSSGQEPYSIALTLREAFPQLDASRAHILATDLSEAILDTAREGRFKQMEINRGLPARLATQYFQREGMYWRAKPVLRELIEFKAMNLAEAWSLYPRPDIVFLRNVLIYFDVPTRKRILDTVAKNMAPDGVLFLGAAESTLNVDDRWVTEKHGPARYYRLPQQEKR